jgi:transketolase
MQKLTTLEDLTRMAVALRRDVISMLTEAGSGHTAGSLGLSDIATALYFNVLNITPKTKNDPERDRLFVSCGHTAPIWYAALARAGFFPIEELKTLRKLGSRLQGHIDRLTVPGVESSSASLGQGLGIAAGCALAGKMNNQRYETYCVISDGELDEGSTWEAANLAAHYRLGRLTAILDRNNIQIDGATEDVMRKEAIKDKFEAFGWHVIEIDGHNMEQIIDGCQEAHAIVEAPVLLLAHTIPGKGVSFMEHDYTWHGKAPTKEEAQMALKELEGMLSERVYKIF